ncbi:hypothetical protein [Agarivorans sp. Alg241-V36]|uniref:hypothetical protein n=1 Tax=Agarivorans sp. Alg241-V36 TaxID=2305992 RepID=UPI0013D45ED5|nr:hypothetical protein [Agarivorans sp. Alg241-V36]
MKNLPIAAGVFAILSSFNLWATPVTSFVVGGVCDPSSATLNSIMESGEASELLGGANPSYSASACLVFDGNDDGNANDPQVNIGQKDDGLLNTKYGPDDSLFFIEPEELQNLDNFPAGIADDPGWIHLASVGGAIGQNDQLSVNYDQAGPVTSGGLFLDIDALLNMTFTCVDDDNGECKAVDWVIETDPSIIDQVSQLLGEATFDHLVFSIKAGNGFILYDFDFIDIFAQELSDYPASSLNFNTPYKLSGSLDTGDFLNPNGNSAQAISHLNVWARDPSDPSIKRINEPSTFGIFILAVLGVISARLARKNTQLS